MDVKHRLKSIFEGRKRRRSRHARELTGLATGFVQLDRITGGLDPGQLVLVAGRPSMGKSSLAMNIVLSASKYAQSPALLCTLESTKYRAAERMLLATCGLGHRRFVSGNLDEFEWDKVAAGFQSLSEVQIIVEDNPRLTASDIHRLALQIQRERGLGLVLVDYLELLQSDSENSDPSLAAAKNMSSLKQMATELNVPVIVCAQVSRGVESRDDKRPRLEDLADGGTVSSWADLVMFIYRDEVYNPDTEDHGIAEIHIAKHRNGPITTSKHGVRLAFIPQFTKFANLSLRDDDPPPMN